MNATTDNTKFETKLTRAEFVSEPGAPTPVKLSHVSIRSSENWSKMIEFYQTLLNLRQVYTIKGRIQFCMLSFDDENHRVGIAQVPNLRNAAAGQTCLEHSSWTYASIEQVFAAVRRFHAKTGMWPHHTVHQGPVIAVSYLDPDGNRVELTGDIYGSQAEIIQYFHDHYEDTSFNTLLRFDMTKMLALYDEGMPIEELTQYDKVLELLAANRL